MLLAAPAGAVPDVSFTVRSWTLEDGLPTSTVQDLGPGPPGYLWLTTTGRIARFDGRRFEVFGAEQELPNNRFQGLGLIGDAPAFYASSEDGSLVRWDGQGFTTLPPAGPVMNSLCVLRDGA